VVTRAAIITVLLSSGQALAGWSNAGPVAGTVSDLYLVDGGVTIVSTSSGASAIAYDGGVLASVAGAVVGAGLTPSGCLVALGAARNFISQPCATPTALVGAYTISRFRSLPTGNAEFLGVTVASNSIYFATSVLGPYAAVAVPTWLRNTSQSMGVALVGGSEVSVFNQATAGVQVSTNGGAQAAHVTNFVALDAVPFSRAGTLAIIAVANDGGLTFTDGGVVFPAGPVVQNVAFVTNETDGGQRGYGLATTANGTVYSPIPDPAHPGETWVVRARAPALGGRVHCESAQFCAGVAAGTLQVLENRGAPVFDFDGGVVTGGSTIIFEVDAGDPDDDPVFVEWSVPNATVTPLVADQHQVQLTVPPLACGATLPVTISVIDGLAGHETKATFPVATPPVAVLGLTPSVPLTVEAGSAAITFTAGFDGGCVPAGAPSWQVANVAQPAGPTATYTPPLNLCVAGGQVVPVSVTQGNQTVNTTVTVQPWGPAIDPQFPQQVRQDAGTTVSWVPSNNDHVCPSSSGFPGTALVDWQWDAGQQGVIVTPGPQSLTIAAPECVQTTVVARARRVVIGAGSDGGPVSVTDAGTLIIDVLTTLDPLSGFSMGFAGYDGGFASGAFTVAGGNCLDHRALSATIDVQPVGGGDAGVISFPMVPGPWQVTVPGGCAGGDFQATAHLFSQGVDTGLTDVVPRFSTGRLDAYAGDLTPARVSASCGGGASANLTLQSMPGTCESAIVTWTQTAGPQMNVLSQSGRTLTVQSQSLGFDLVGQTITWSVDVNGGPGNELTVTRDLTIDGPRFVRLVPRLSPIQIAAEDALVGEVTLVNESDCDASGLELSIDLGGLLPVEGSLQLDGRPVEGALASGQLQLPVDLGARQHRSVRFLGRARLLGAPGLVARASLGGVPVELPATVSSPLTSCGCSSAGGPSLIGLLALCWRASRRVKKGTAA
jgi:hypothetical protein